MATDSEFLYRAAFTTGVMGSFLDDPDNMSNILHFTPNDECSVYDEVDPDKRPGLSQVGKVVVITGAGRGVGRVSVEPSSYQVRKVRLRLTCCPLCRVSR